MFSQIKITNTKTTLLFITTVVIISELTSHYLKNKKVFSSSWMYSAFGFLIGYLFYILFIEDMKIMNIKPIIVKQTIFEMMRYSSLLFISNIIFNYFEYGFINLNLLWILKTIFIIIGYLLPDYIFINKIVNLNNYKLLFYNLSKIFISNITMNLLFNNYITTQDFVDNTSFIFGYLFWELLIKKYLI